MKNLIALLSLTLFSVSSYSYQINSKIRLQAETEKLEKYLEITCNTQTDDADFCSQLCGVNEKCEVPETICEDCATTNSQILKTIFTGVTSIFKADINFVEKKPLISFFKTKKFMSIPYNVFLNPFTPELKVKIKTEFEKLCYIKVTQATLLVAINEESKIEDLVGVICDDTRGSVVLPIQLNPEFSKKNIHFWEPLNEEIESRLGELKLKMSGSLDLVMQTAPTEMMADTTALTKTLNMKPTVVPTKIFDSQIQRAQPLSTMPLSKVTMTTSQIPASINIPTAQLTTAPAALTVSAQAMMPTYIEPVLETTPEICKKNAFHSDGTNSSMDDEYYEKCIRPQAKPRRR